MRGEILKWGGVFLLCFVLQTTVIPLIGIAGITPDLLMAALFFLAIKNGQTTAVGVGFFLGLAQDLFSAPSILGQNALSKTLAGFFAGFFNERMMRVDFVFQIVLLFVTFLVNDAAYFIVQAIKTDGGGILHNLTATSVPRALYSMLFALLPYIRHRFFSTRSRR
ncbi:MAG: rod shape-determining protein MreD [Chitinispirillaceae bacterium]|nr:rod shape-determining protein MreD [Chitinispirillaceae bacterium]